MSKQTRSTGVMQQGMESVPENDKPVLLSAIYSVDEFPWLDYVPWKEALHSLLNFVDECVVVHGGKQPTDVLRSAKKYIQNLQDPRIRLLTFPWPKAGEFDWMQIARSLSYGYLHCRGEWCFRGLMDEVFPDDFIEIRDLLQNLPADKTVVSVGRHYLLGTQAAFPYRHLPLFFRRNSGLAYGRINPRQGPEADPISFGTLVDTTRWFDGARVIPAERPTLLERSDAKERLLADETPKGYRDPSSAHVYVWDKAFFNTDVNYFHDHFIVQQKWQSIQGYQLLPEPYTAKLDERKEDILPNHQRKIKRMLDGRFYKAKVPESLVAFADRHADVHNIVRQLVEKRYGLKWCRISDERSWKKRLLATFKLMRR